jgi:hypothetical protein
MPKGRRLDSSHVASQRLKRAIFSESKKKSEAAKLFRRFAH